MRGHSLIITAVQFLPDYIDRRRYLDNKGVQYRLFQRSSRRVTIWSSKRRRSQASSIERSEDWRGRFEYEHYSRSYVSNTVNRIRTNTILGRPRFRRPTTRSLSGHHSRFISTKRRPLLEWCSLLRWAQLSGANSSTFWEGKICHDVGKCSVCAVIPCQHSLLKSMHVPN